MRLACVFAPQIALQAVLRREPGAAATAVALCDGPSPRAKVVACTDSARRGGVRPGMTAAQARVVAAALRVVTAPAADVEAAEAALGDVGYGFAPRVEVEPGRVFLEVGDLLRLYPSEQAVAQGLVAAAVRVGLTVRVAIASSKGIARICTRARAVAVVPEPTIAARAFVAAMPVGILDDCPRDTLARWGIATLGELCALPAADVTVRLGTVGTRIWRLAAGLDDEPFTPRLPADALEEGTDLDYPIYEIEPLSFVLRGLLDRALARLACQQGWLRSGQGEGQGVLVPQSPGGGPLACAGITLRLRLDPKGVDVREIPIAAPTRDAATLLQLVRLDLARRPPDAAVIGLQVVALAARARSTQLDFLRPSGPAPDRLAATIARLAALVGPENVGVPRTVDTHREEAISVGEMKMNGGGPHPGPLPEGEGGDKRERAEGLLGIRRFRPAQEVEVLMGRDGPTALRGKQTTARVLVAAGPYRTSGEWWREGGFHRDYWDVHASDGVLYRVHQDRKDGRWYLDGYYD